MNMNNNIRNQQWACSWVVISHTRSGARSIVATGWMRAMKSRYMEARRRRQAKIGPETGAMARVLRNCDAWSFAGDAICSPRGCPVLVDAGPQNPFFHSHTWSTHTYVYAYNGLRPQHNYSLRSGSVFMKQEQRKLCRAHTQICIAEHGDMRNTHTPTSYAV